MTPCFGEIPCLGEEDRAERAWAGRAGGAGGGSSTGVRVGELSTERAIRVHGRGGCRDPGCMRHPHLPRLLLAREHSGSGLRPDRDRSLQRIRAGVYVERAVWIALAPWERYALRVEAVAATWTAPVFCLESAASVQGLPLFGEPRCIHLLDAGGTTWREGDVVVHGTRDARSVANVDGMLVTPVLDTTLDLCRVLVPAFALAVADSAARTSGPLGSLGAYGREQVSRRGIRQLDWIDENVDPASESPGESVSRAVIGWLGYERPELQVRHRYEGVEDRVDFQFPSTRAVGESDGYGKYDAADAEATKRRFIEEKRREDRLRRHGHPFARWDWGDVLAITPLDRALRAAGLVPPYPRDERRLATLSRNPRSLPRPAPH